MKTKRKIQVRIILVAMMGLLFMFGTSTTIFAQDETKETTEKPAKKKSKFGSFLRKVGESATGINMSDETFIAWDLKAQTKVELSFISAEGDVASREVLLTFSAKTKQSGISLEIAGISTSDEQDFAADLKGNRFEIDRKVDAGKKDLIEGIPVFYKIALKNVPIDLPAIEVVSLGYYLWSKDSNIGSGMAGTQPMQIRNIPIQWNNPGTENLVGWTASARLMCDLNVVSCIGDASGNVVLTLAATAKNDNLKLELGKTNNNSQIVEAFNNSGANYEGTCPGSYSECVGQKELIKGLPVQFQFVFSGIENAIPSFDLIKSEFYLWSPNGSCGSNMSGVQPVQIRNIRIAWE